MGGLIQEGAEKGAFGGEGGEVGLVGWIIEEEEGDGKG